MAYINLKNTTIEEYDKIIYSGDAKYKLKITFNGQELEEADRYCEKMTRKIRVLPDDSSKRFTLDNFIAQTIEIVFHNVDYAIMQEPINISLGTLIDKDKNLYEYVPLGVFNIQDKSTTDKNVTTLKLIDNRTKFDVPYDGKELIDTNGGSATKKQILNDICAKVGVTNDIDSFLGENDIVGIYDNSINATTYVSYLLEQAGSIPIITREGHLDKVELNNLTSHRIPSNIVEENFSKYKDNNFKIERVVYEDAIRKFDSNTDETTNGSTLQTVYINSANPYISNQEQIEQIYDKIKGFEISSVVTQKVLANPRIDPWDLIEVYDYYSSEETKPVLFKTLANQTFTYSGACIAVYKTEIGIEAQKENVTVKSQAALKKWARTEIDNVNGTIQMQTSAIVETQNEQSQKLAQVTQTVNDYDISIKNVQKSLESANGTIETLEGKITDINFNFSTKGLSIGTSTDSNNSLLDNSGIRVYNYTKLNAIFNNKGSGIDKLIVTGTAQIGYLKFVKSTKNNKKVTKIFHLKELIEDLEDLEV